MVHPMDMTPKQRDEWHQEMERRDEQRKLERWWAEQERRERAFEMKQLIRDYEET